MFGAVASFRAAFSVVVLAAESDVEVAAIAAIAAATKKAAIFLILSFVSGPTPRHVWSET